MGDVGRLGCSKVVVLGCSKVVVFFDSWGHPGQETQVCDTFSWRLETAQRASRSFEVLPPSTGFCILVGVIQGHGDAFVVETLLEISTQCRLFRFSSGQPLRRRIESLSKYLIRGTSLLASGLLSGVWDLLLQGFLLLPLAGKFLSFRGRSEKLFADSRCVREVGAAAGWLGRVSRKMGKVVVEQLVAEGFAETAGPPKICKQDEILPG